MKARKIFKVKAARFHQGVTKFRFFECELPVVPRAAKAIGWWFVSAERTG